MSHPDVLFVLPPLYAFMKTDFPESRLGPGYLAAYLKERGITSRIYNADIYNKADYRSARRLAPALRRFIRAARGFRYFAGRWAAYYKNVDDLNHPAWQDLRFVLRTLKPRVVGISASMVTIPSSLAAARIAREELPDATVIAGGPAATTCAEELIHSRAIDFLVLGEGEETMAELSLFLLGREGRPARLEDIRGIMYRRGHEIITTPARPLIANLDSLPFPDRDSMFILDGGVFRTVRFNAGVLASRGCPYPCKFCASFAVWGSRKARLRSADNIFAEIIHLNRSYGQRSFVFWDDLFTVNREATAQLCEKIISSGLDIEWICLARVNTIDAGLLAIMKRAGCREIQIGVESGNERILRGIGKDLTVGAVMDKSSMVRSAGIELGVFLIIGFPSETRAEMEDTLRLIRKIRPTWVNISIFTPYPGTDFFNELNRQGRIDSGFIQGDFWYPDKNYTGTMEDSEFSRFAVRALGYADRYNMRRMFRIGYVWKKLKK